MKQTPYEREYWKRVFPENDGKPSFLPYSGSTPQGFPRFSQPESQPTTNIQQTQNTEIIMEFIGYIEDIRQSVTTLTDGTKRENLIITLKEQYDNLKDSFSGIVVYIKPDLVENVKCLLAADTNRLLRYRVKCDSYVKRSPSKTNPNETYRSMYLRAWSFEQTI